MQFQITFQLEPLTKALQGLHGQLSQSQLLLGSIGQSMLNVNRDRHDKGLAPDGTPWKKLAASTLANKRGSKRILYDRGDLLRFHSQVSGDSVMWGTNDKKAIWHHSGTGTYGERGSRYEIRPKVKKALAFGGLVRSRVSHPGIPARPLVGFPAGDEAIVKNTIADFLLRGIQS
jgi:phage gpG-like protein